MKQSLSFDGMAELYDDFRVVEEKSMDAALDYIVQRYPPERYSHVFEPGIGNGRIAFPLVSKGYQVSGMDISGEMLAQLETRIINKGLAGRISFQKGDVAKLPYPDKSFDLAIAVHLFWFVAEWKKAIDELVRVLKPGGPIILMNTGGGKEIPAVNDRYKEICSALGNPVQSVGVKDTQEVLDYLISLGMRIETIEGRWKWDAKVSIAEAVEYIRKRQLSFTRSIPEEIHQKVCIDLKREFVKDPGDTTVVHNGISLYVASRYQ